MLRSLNPFFDSEWSQSIHRQVEGLYYDSLLLDYYRPFWNMGIPVDFVTAEEELDGYDLVLAPMLMMVYDEGKKNIESYAQAGEKFCSHSEVESKICTITCLQKLYQVHLQTWQV